MKISDPIKRLPKAELHVHIEGTVVPAMARHKAAQHGITLPDIFTDGQSEYSYCDFVDAVTRVYDAVASTIRTKQDYTDITYDYLKRCAAEKVIYVELIASADHATRVNLTYKDMIDGIVEGILKARAETDIEARINVALVRHLPEAELDRATENILTYRHPYIVGVDLAGAEKEGDVLRHLKYILKIKESSNGELGLKPHASEAAGPINTWHALTMEPQRIGHGVRSIEDPRLVRELARRGTVLEVALTSNDKAGIYPALKDHPLRKLYDAGVKVTLNSDDPGLFNCTISDEYQLAHDRFGFTPPELLGVTRTAVEAAFVDEKTRAKLLKRVDEHDFFPNLTAIGSPQWRPGPG